MAPIAAPAAVASDLRSRRDAERDADEGEFAIAGAQVEPQDLRQDRRERCPVGELAARPDRVPERVYEADAGPAGLADAREVRGHEHLRARLEVACRPRPPAAATPRPSG